MTRRVLRAVGLAGKDGDDFNWCAHNELVGMFGRVCDSPCKCGCNVAFTGLASLRSTNRARVCEIGEEAWEEIKLAFTVRYAEAWCNSRGIVDEAVESLETLSLMLRCFEVGTVVKLSKLKDRKDRLYVD